MIINNVTQVGNKVIRSKAKSVSNPLSRNVQNIIIDLIDTMRHHGLVGIAAPQIGKGLRIFVTEIRPTKHRKVNQKDNLRIFINPKIIKISIKKVRGWEGCGSVADTNLFGKVERSQSIVVSALSEKGQPFKLEAKDLLAKVIQHELDHLNGIVFTDRAILKTLTSRSEYLKIS